MQADGPLLRVEGDAGDAVGVAAGQQVQGRERGGQPVEERIIRLGVVEPFLQGAAVEAGADQRQVEDVEKRVGDHRVAAGRGRIAVGAADVGIAPFQQHADQVERGLRIDEEGVLVDIDGHVAVAVAEHRVEIAVGALVGEPDAGDGVAFRIAKALEKPFGEAVQLQVEGARVDFNAGRRHAGFSGPAARRFRR